MLSGDKQVEAFCDLLYDGFLKANDVKTIDYQIAKKHTKIHLNKPLLPLSLPLSHLCKDVNQTPDMEIFVWESPSGWTPPAPIWKQSQIAAHGEIRGLGDRFRASYVKVHSSGLFQIIDFEKKRAFYWIAKSSDLPFWELGSPFRIIFHWWAKEIGGHLAHAAGVGINGSGALLIGKGGSGKSSCSLLCLSDGMQFIGDDYVWLSKENEPIAYSLYSSAKVHANFRDTLLPSWHDFPSMPVGPENKHIFFLNDILPQCLVPSLKIRSIIIPQISKECGMLPSHLSDAILSITPSTLFQLPGTCHQSVKYLTDFVQTIPVFNLRTGNDLAAIPRYIRQSL